MSERLSQSAKEVSPASPSSSRLSHSNKEANGHISSSQQTPETKRRDPSVAGVTSGIGRRRPRRRSVPNVTLNNGACIYSHWKLEGKNREKNKQRQMQHLQQIQQQPTVNTPPQNHTPTAQAPSSTQDGSHLLLSTSRKHVRIERSPPTSPQVVSPPTPPTPSSLFSPPSPSFAPYSPLNPSTPPLFSSAPSPQLPLTLPSQPRLHSITSLSNSQPCLPSPRSPVPSASPSLSYSKVPPAHTLLFENHAKTERSNSEPLLIENNNTLPGIQGLLSCGLPPIGGTSHHQFSASSPLLLLSSAASQAYPTPPSPLSLSSSSSYLSSLSSSQLNPVIQINGYDSMSTDEGAGSSSPLTLSGTVEAVKALQLSDSRERMSIKNLLDDEDDSMMDLSASRRARRRNSPY